MCFCVCVRFLSVLSFALCCVRVFLSALSGQCSFLRLRVFAFVCFSVCEILRLRVFMCVCFCLAAFMCAWSCVHEFCVYVFVSVFS